jgi:hypothetical protein
VHDIVVNLGLTKSLAIPAFHAFTGCHVTSSFFGKGKRSAWAAWKTFPAITEAFNTLCSVSSTDTIKEILPTIEAFVAHMYGADRNGVDEVRHLLFTTKGKSFAEMPPSSDALFHHILRVAYQVLKLTTVTKTCS